MKKITLKIGIILLFYIFPFFTKAQKTDIFLSEQNEEIKQELTREYFLKTYNRNDEVNILFPQVIITAFPYIQVLVSVTDQNGEPITGLKRSNFTITEDQQDINSFSLTEQDGNTGLQPVSVALVIDVSGSMSSSDMAYARNAAIEFVNNMSNYDRAAVVKFSSSASIVQTMTSNKEILIAAINTLTAGGSTAMFDGFYLGIQQCAPETGIRAVIGFTDGDNNAGSYNQSQVINYANQVGLPIYSIGVGSVTATPLQQMANATGGSYYYAPSPAEIGEIYDQIAQNIENQYQIVFMTPNISMDGEQREVEINITLDQ